VRGSSSDDAALRHFAERKIGRSFIFHRFQFLLIRCQIISACLMLSAMAA